VAGQAGWRHLIWWPTLSLAGLARQQGELDEGDELLQRAFAMCPRLARRARRADCLDELVLLRAAQGRRDDARAADAEAEQCRRDAHVQRTPVHEAARAATLRAISE